MTLPRLLFWIIAIFFVQQLPGVAGLGVDLPLIFVVLMGVRSEASAAGA